ncbi:uncharacterized protein EV422DRAFT_542336 [Fimicolochytrium jonesii]|uniref:uncharacterized protein n=1 Tax=Fimicolochytrium jonesii TaxID=1396493 RepID=UPI0022FE3EAC|nr:uncharacterized protein EV422DRAFT_542336 [Fimicolochytrium jonesii]KAI8817302.1 hypothetical protein EV422DRAFT_542336 [Fimicolochytrium jonesii]
MSDSGDHSEPNSATSSDSPTPPLQSTAHFYDDATVRIIVEHTVFAVHKSLLKKFSKYFDTMFTGQWREAQALGIKPEVSQKQPVHAIAVSDVTTGALEQSVEAIEDSNVPADAEKVEAIERPDVTVAPLLNEIFLEDLDGEHFESFLDIIYEFNVNLITLNVSKLLGILFTSEYLLADRIFNATKFALRAIKKDWRNIAEFVRGLHGYKEPLAPCLASIRSECVEFFRNAMQYEDRCIRVLHFAESYHYPELLTDEFKEKWPRKPFLDLSFQNLSIELQHRLLMKLTECTCGKAEPKGHAATCPRNPTS